MSRLQVPYQLMLQNFHQIQKICYHLQGHCLLTPGLCFSIFDSVLTYWCIFSPNIEDAYNLLDTDYQQTHKTFHRLFLTSSRTVTESQERQS